MKNLYMLFLILNMGIATLFASEYQVDKEASMVTFKIRHAVIAKVEGKFNDFSGSYEYDDALNYFISFEGKAEIASIDTDDKYRDEHLRLKLFESQKYPEIHLKLIKQSGSSFLTELTIKDQTKEVDFSISRMPDTANKFLLEGEINRKDFGLNFSDTAEMGGLVVGEEVKINIVFVGK